MVSGGRKVSLNVILLLEYNSIQDLANEVQQQVSTFLENGRLVSSADKSELAQQQANSQQLIDISRKQKSKRVCMYVCSQCIASQSSKYNFTSVKQDFASE